MTEPKQWNSGTGTHTLRAAPVKAGRQRAKCGPTPRLQGTYRGVRCGADTF